MENKEQKKQYDKVRYQKNKDTKLKYQNEYNLLNKEKRLKIKRESYKLNSNKYIKETLERIKKQPLKHKARSQALYNIKIPLNQNCQICNKQKARDRHHIDYNKPLEVILLCRSCHKKEHDKLKNMEIKNNGN
jgi:hypothetical protein